MRWVSIDASIFPEVRKDPHRQQPGMEAALDCHGLIAAQAGTEYSESEAAAAEAAEKAEAAGSAAARTEVQLALEPGGPRCPMQARWHWLLTQARRPREQLAWQLAQLRSKVQTWP